MWIQHVKLKFKNAYVLCIIETAIVTAVVSAIYFLKNNKIDISYYRYGVLND